MRFFLVLICMFTCATLSQAQPPAKPVYVQLMVDEEEATTDEISKERLVNRLKSASAHLFPYSGIDFVPVSFGKWDSDDRLASLERSLAEFEHEIRPTPPAQLTIGFSSQYQFVSGRNHLGGTRGPLRAHILMRESAPRVEEREKTEVLIHELGHFLGASHSSRQDSVMRPKLGDGQSRRKDFKIRFDPSNAAILRLVGKELRERNVRSFAHLSQTTLTELRPHYEKLAADLPKDQSSKRFLLRVDAALGATTPPKVEGDPLKQPFRPR